MYEVTDIVKITGCVGGHKFEIGEDVTIIRVFSENSLYVTNGVKKFWVGPEEIELVKKQNPA